MAFVLNVVLAFVTTLIAARAWVRYMHYSHTGQAVRAGIADCTIIAIGMTNVISYTQDRWMAVPILLATFIGTVAAVKAKTSHASETASDC